MLGLSIASSVNQPDMLLRARQSLSPIQWTEQTLNRSQLRRQQGDLG
jgi:hypothetical protein